MKKEFEIDTEIYSKDIIPHAIWDFEDVWEIKFENNRIIISWDNEEEIKEIFNEFMNYCVSLINE